jgi:hypothetical protein
MNLGLAKEKNLQYYQTIVGEEVLEVDRKLQATLRPQLFRDNARRLPDTGG